jgi:DNA processing protein
LIRQSMDKKAYWVGFNMVRGIGSVRLRAILDHFGDLEIAWNAPADGLAAAGLTSKVIDNFMRLRRDVNLNLVWDQIQHQGIQVITWDEEAYPARLQEIDQPPPVLYMRGSILPEDSWAVAVVGTRRVTAYGRQVASEVAAFLGQNGITLVSGLARGVDAIAHEAALKNGGRSIAVLGSGVDTIYPPENLRLAEKMAQQGAVISDYAPGTPPDAVNFPPRNRIISGLSLGVVVVEAGETSGALITATFAANQGRDVFAVPGNINAPQSRGTNRLIQDGARPLLRPEDLLDLLHLERIESHKEARRDLPSDPTESRLLHEIALEPLHIDEIRSRSGLPIEIVSATLTMMELKGMVRQVGGMQYQAVREEGSEYGVEFDDN